MDAVGKLGVALAILSWGAIFSQASARAECYTINANAAKSAEKGESACQLKEGDQNAVIASNCSAVAFLIGTSNYKENWSALSNSINDVRAIGNALPTSFIQIKAEDCKINDLKKAAEAFLKLANVADVAFVYISSHGFEYGGENYIVPITHKRPIYDKLDAVLYKNQLETDFVNISSILVKVRPKLYSIIFLDACRDDPLINSKVVAKFAFKPIIQNGGQLVVYSTSKSFSAYNAAPEGTSPGPFAGALEKRLRTPHQSIDDIVRGMTDEVAQKTQIFNPIQMPYTSGSSRMKLYFRPAVVLDPPKIVQQDSLSPKQVKKLRLSIDELRLLDGAVLADLATQRHSVDELEQLANDGVGDAAYLLGFLYHYGVGVAADQVRAREWLEISVRANSAAGKTLLAYVLPKTGEADKNRAIALYQDAAAADYPKAKANLGDALINGRLGNRDAAQGWALIDDAAVSGYAWAIEKLASKPDKSGASKSRAIMLMQRLESRKIATASNWLCMTFTADRRYVEAFQSCRAGADADQSASQGYLAVLYARGLGTAASSADAIYWKTIASGKPYQSSLSKTQRHWLAEQLGRIK